MIHVFRVPQPGRALVDRQTLAYMSGRSVHTIRSRCPVDSHTEHDGRRRPLYDLYHCVALLEGIPIRNRAGQRLL